MSSKSIFRPKVIELAGLPGAGKTTVAVSAANTNDRFLPHVVGEQAESGRDPENAMDPHLGSSGRRFRPVLILPWFVTPITLLRFRSFLVRLFALLFVLKVRSLLGRNRSHGITAERAPSFFLILGRLNFVVTRRAQVLIRSRRSQKSILVEQGYVQEAISIRLRLPQEWRDDLWARYFNGVPRNCLCIVLEISAQEALRRIGLRDETQLLIPFSRRAQKSWQTDADDDWLSRALEEIESKLRSAQLNSRFEFEFVPAARESDEVLDDVLKEAERLSR